jgi:integrating conjugative element protein (TIGR03761 family)
MAGLGSRALLAPAGEAVQGVQVIAFEMGLGRAGQFFDAADSGAAVCQQPAMVDLVFGTPYGFMGAYLLSDYDELARTVLTAQHCAVIDRQRAGELIRACGNAVRRVYQLPAAWRRTDITRDDVRHGTDAAVNAAHLMGAVP